MARAIILMLDSLGVGAAPDAARFGVEDAKADTLGHIAQAAAEGRADRAGLRSGALKAPNLARLGFGLAGRVVTGKVPQGLETMAPQGAIAACAEVSRGKDTPSGHWEMAGVPVTFDWGYFPETIPTFPQELTDALIREAGLPGVLGNKHASGTVILEELGAEHIATGEPILYTSADSVIQIAAHEESFGLQRLYEVCKIARKLVDAYNIGRVIARPFVGSADTGFRRTGNRKDYSVLPPAPTLLDVAKTAGREVYSVGKIGDIFAHSGTGHELKADGNMALFDATLGALRDAPDGSLILSNFVDFDTLFGHRRDVAGYAAAIEDFDRRLPELEAALKPGDLVVLSADHGCDPTAPGSDHTREYVPAVFFGPGLEGRIIGKRDSFADIGQTMARHIGLPKLSAGEAML